MGRLRKATDCDGFSCLIMSTLEGAILICKASKGSTALLKTVETLKSVIAFYRASLIFSRFELTDKSIHMGVEQRNP